jgi:hypothetical protein
MDDTAIYALSVAALTILIASIRACIIRSQANSTIGTN